MKKISMMSMGRSAAVVALGLGATFGVGVAAGASPVGHRDGHHDGQARHHGRWGHEARRVEGRVTGYTSGQSITVQTWRSSTPVTYSLTTSTSIFGVAAGASPVIGDHVSLLVSSTTPVVVIAIRVQTPEAIHVEGLVTGYSAGASITVQTRRSSTPLTFTLTSNTSITGLAAGVSVVVGDHVYLVLASTVSGNVDSIRVQTPEAIHVSGVVTAYAAGNSIAIENEDATTPTTYALTPATTTEGLATGVNLAVGDHVKLLLSSTSPVTVTSIVVAVGF